jgi:hypothetical protein
MSRPFLGNRKELGQTPAARPLGRDPIPLTDLGLAAQLLVARGGDDADDVHPVGVPDFAGQPSSAHASHP